MHSEHYYVKKEDADKINEAKLNKKRVIAVGTTSCRTLETIADEKTGLVKNVKVILEYIFIRDIILNV